MHNQLDRVRAIVSEHGAQSDERLEYWVEIVTAGEEGAHPQEVQEAIREAMEEWASRHMINKTPTELLLIALDMLGRDTHDN